MQQLISFSERLAKLLGSVGMVLLPLMAAHIFLSIGTRWVTGKEIPGTLEVVTYYYMVGVTFLPLALLARRNAHLSADLFIQKYSPRHRLLVELIVHLSFVFYLSVMAYQTYLQAVSASSYGEAVPTASGMFPTWPSRWFLPLGAGAAALVSLILSASRVARLLGGREEETQP